MRDQCWISLYSLDVQNAFSWFQRAIDLHFEEHFLKRTFTMSNRNRLPWQTEKLRTQIKDKNAMHTQVVLSPGDQQMTIRCKTLRNKVTSALRNAELKHYSDELELHTCKSDLHKTWGVLRAIIRKDANNLKPRLKFQVNDKLIRDSMEIANSFNEFFVTIGPKLAQTIKSTSST